MPLVSPTFGRLLSRMAEMSTTVSSRPGLVRFRVPAITNTDCQIIHANMAPILRAGSLRMSQKTIEVNGNERVRACRLQRHRRGWNHDNPIQPTLRAPPPRYQVYVNDSAQGLQRTRRIKEAVPAIEHEKLCKVHHRLHDFG